MKYKVAFATDDGKNLVDKHYGDADYYVIYEISKEESVFVEKRENTTEKEEDEIHGDPRKASSIGQLMKGVQILCNKQFGQNIKRMKKKFLPILFDIDNIEEAIKIIQSRFDEVQKEWDNGEDRKYLTFRVKK